MKTVISDLKPRMLALKPSTFRLAVILSVCFAASFGMHAQNDTLVLINGDVMVGELKKMTNAVVQFETDYSDSDFKVEWDKVIELYTTTFFLVSLHDGTRLNGVVRTSPTDSSVILIDDGTTITETTVIDILYLQSVKKNIWSRFDVLLEAGFNITKANNLRQFNSRTGFGYTARTWSAKSSYNAIISNQDSVAATKRTDASINANWFLQHDWFLFAAADFLQNDEQKIKLRTTPKFGIGNYILRNNYWFLAASAGLAMNIEKFQSDQPDRSSIEGFVGAEANLFNINDFSMLLKVATYPGISEGGRFRSDINLDLKYDLFGSDFYIKFGITYNFDNRPAANASNSDYVFQTTVGWEL